MSTSPMSESGEGFMGTSPLGESAESPLLRAQEAMSVTRVFGEPYEKDGVTFIPVARFAGGMGGGGGKNKEEGESTGFGFGMGAQPLGAFVIKEGKVRWIPTVDVNRVIMGAQIAGIVMMLVMSRAFRARRRRGWAAGAAR